MKRHTRTLLLLTAVLFVGQSSHAATGVSLDPPRVEFKAQPGGTINSTINVFNPGAKGAAPLQVSTAFNDWILNGEGKMNYLAPGSLPNSLSSWITLAPVSFGLEGNADRDVRYTLKVPANTKPGLYWGVIFFKSDSGKEEAFKPSTAKGGVSIDYKIDVGQIVYVQVGSPKLEGKLTKIVSKQDENGLRISANLNNTGNSLIRATGTVELRNLKGEKVASSEIEEGATLPGFTRTYTTGFKTAVPKGEYLALVALEYQKGKFYTGESRIKVE